jgi:tetratricopeptide (TPR) repeat protein
LTHADLCYIENPAPFIVPFERNPNFTGRATQLAAVESKLFVGVRTSKVAITGLGGIGKTQLLLELVYRNRDKYKNCSVIWILASNMESLQQGYLDVARQLNIPGSDKHNADAKKLVQDYLSNEITGRWLLVFDNTDDVSMWITKSGPASSRLIDYLPRSEQGCIVFTTRDRKAAVKLASQNVVEVPEMDDEVAVQLLQKCLINPELVDNKPDTATLLKELTYLPLAIVQAAAYINENDIAFADYLSLLADQEEVVIDLLSEEFEDDGRYASMKNPVATTWLISFEQIRQRDTLAAEYLSFMACMDPRDIPKSILPEGASRKKELDAIGTLTAYSFVIKRSDLAFDLHRLVHLATRNWLQQNHLISQCTEKAIVRLEEVFPNSNHQNRAKWRTYFPHARYILNSNLLEKDLDSRIDLLWKYGTCLKEDGRWNDAEAAIVEVLAAEERKFGTEHRSTLISMDSLASILWNLGRPKEAEDLGVKVLEKSKRVLGPEHPLTLATLSNLATTYMKQGRFKEAGELNVQVLETKKKVLGPENPETLTVMGNLASTYLNQGRWKEAEELQLEVLETKKRVLGQEDPSTLATMSNLATTYAEQGCWKEAEDLEVQLFESRKRVLGEEHPHTLISMSNLASMYYAQGRWKESEELHLQVMEKKKKTLGLDFPDTIDTMHDLASVYRKQRRWAEAEELGLQVVVSSKRVLGIEHPDTVRAMDGMAVLYSDQKRWREAEDLGVGILALSRKVCGEDHPSTLTRMANLAMVYSNSGRLNTGEEMEREVMEKKKNKLGAEHPSTLSTMHNLACTWKLQGRDREASQLMEECATLQARVIGESHPETLASRGAVLLWRDDF